MFEYEFISNFFTYIRKDASEVYSTIYMGIQFLAASFILLAFIYAYLENTLSWKKIFSIFVSVLAILQFADLMQLADTVIASYVESITFFNLEENGINAAISELYAKIESYPWSLGDLLSSGIIVGITYILYGIAWIVKFIGLPFFLLQRGLFLFLIYLFTPLVAALSIIPTYRQLVYNLIKLFFSIYVLQYIYMIIDWMLAAFVVYATEEINKSIIGMPFNNTTTAVSLMIVVILVSYCSLRLYSAASTISSKFFNT